MSGLNSEHAREITFIIWPGNAWECLGLISEELLADVGLPLGKDKQLEVAGEGRVWASLLKLKSALMYKLTLFLRDGGNAPASDTSTVR